jgi:hypothetical protein
MTRRGDFQDLVKAPWRFWAHVSRTDGCWEWQSATDIGGYGVIRHGGEQWKAHRLAYVLEHGALPEDRIVCHHCDNRRCVRPDHLYAGTYSDNNSETVRRARRAPPLTHCKRGHEFTPDNVLPAYARKGVIGGRRCKVCTLALNKESQARHGERWKAASKQREAGRRSA